VGERRKFQFARLICNSLLRLGLAGILFGCGGQSGEALPSTRHAVYRYGRTHTVARGETLYHIAQQYGVSTSSLIAANQLTDARQLYPGQVLSIPGHGFAESSLAGIPDIWSVPRAERQFAWPILSGVVSSPFGIRHGVMHDGVDIAAPTGTPVHTADRGHVIFAGRLHGYGNVVIVQHSSNYVTVYGHNSRNLVREGQTVERGQEIAELGSSGRASGPNLHFEVRYNNHPQNPLAYLPSPNPASGITFARNSGS
jgi:murein DD-endopeptidase MepM/ murein hydrolase activator NlpD